MAHAAIRSNDEEALKRWLDSSPDINEADSFHQTPLHLAAFEGRTAMVKMLIKKKANVNVRDPKGWTPLHCAASNLHFKTCEMLLSYGKADADARTTNGSTILMYLARHSSDVDVSDQLALMKKVIDAGVEVNARNSNGETSLHLACMRGSIDAVHLLLESGADVNAINHLGESAMHYAVRGRRTLIAARLLKTSPDLSITTTEGHKPLDLLDLGQDCIELRKMLELYVSDPAHHNPFRELKVSGKVPTARYYACSATFNDRVYVFGGCSRLTEPTVYNNETYMLHLIDSEWKVVRGPGQSPPAAAMHAGLAVNDSTFLMVGGRDESNIFAHVWLLSMESMQWQLVSTAGQVMPPLYGHTMLYWEERNKVIVFGGAGSGSQCSNDVYVLSLDTWEWELLQATGRKPVPRRHHSACMYHDTMVVFGGIDNSGTVRNDVSVLDLESSSWMEVPTTGATPLARHSHSATMIKEDVMLVFGGSSSDGKALADPYTLYLRPMQWVSHELGKTLPHVERVGHVAHLFFKNKLYITTGSGWYTTHMLDVDTLNVLRVGEEPQARPTSMKFKPKAPAKRKPMPAPPTSTPPAASTFVTPQAPPKPAGLVTSATDPSVVRPEVPSRPRRHTHTASVGKSRPTKPAPPPEGETDAVSPGKALSPEQPRRIVVSPEAVRRAHTPEVKGRTRGSRGRGRGRGVRGRGREVRAGGNLGGSSGTDTGSSLESSGEEPPPKPAVPKRKNPPPAVPPTKPSRPIPGGSVIVTGSSSMQGEDEAAESRTGSRSVPSSFISQDSGSSIRHTTAISSHGTTSPPSSSEPLSLPRSSDLSSARAAVAAALAQCKPGDTAQNPGRRRSYSQDEGQKSFVQKRSAASMLGLDDTPTVSRLSQKLSNDYTDRSLESTAAVSRSKKRQPVAAAKAKHPVEILVRHTRNLQDQSLLLVELLENEMGDVELSPAFRAKLMGHVKMLKSTALSAPVDLEQIEETFEGGDTLDKMKDLLSSNVKGVKERIQKKRAATVVVEEEPPPPPPPLPRQYYEQIKVPPPWGETVDPLAENASKDDKQQWKRNNIVNELMQTEIDYERDLAVIVGLYLKPLDHEYADVCPPHERAKIFSNADELLNITRSLREALERQSKRPSEQQCIGQVFVDHMMELKKYKTYCTNQKESSETVEKLRSSNPAFVEFLNRVKAEHEENKNLEIEGQLIKPFQRIVRYSLLLKELMNATPKTWLDHTTISKALARIELIVQEANEDKRMTDNILKIIEIQNSVTFQGEEVQLGATDCKFVEEGDLHLHEADAKRHVFLFNTVLLITKKISKGKYKSTSIVNLDQALLWDLPQTVKQQSKKRKYGFQVVGGQVPQTFVFAEEAACERWRAKVTECISALV